MTANNAALMAEWSTSVGKSIISVIMSIFYSDDAEIAACIVHLAFLFAVVPVPSSSHYLEDRLPYLLGYRPPVRRPSSTGVVSRHF